MITAKLPMVDPATGEMIGEQDLWNLNADNDPVYNRQLTNVQRVRQRKGGRLVERWVEKTVGARHDYHDCESYNVALALGPGACHALPTEQELLEESRRLAQRAKEAGTRPRGHTTPDGRAFLANHRK